MDPKAGSPLWGRPIRLSSFALTSRLMARLEACPGVLISQCAVPAQEAQQKRRAVQEELVTTVNLAQVPVIAGAVLPMFDLALPVAAAARFQPTRSTGDG
jgi:hypothetical protein